MIMEAETRVMHLEAKECQRLLAKKKKKKRLLATSEPKRNHGPASTLDPSEETAAMIPYSQLLASRTVRY